MLAAVEALPERFRTVVAHRFLIGLSEAETATTLGIPPGTVKSRTARGLARLRAELEDSMSDRADVESALARAAGSVDWPEADLVGRVGRGLSRPAPRPWLRWAPAVVVVLVVVMASVVPGARRAVADLLGIVGIDVELGDQTPPLVGSGPQLGSGIDLADVPEAVAFDPLVPDLSDLDEPGAVYLSSGSSPILSMVWEQKPPFGTVLFSQFAAVEGDEVLAKELGQAAEIRSVEVAGADGIWIEGVPHLVVDESGPDEPLARLAANVLAWNVGGVTYRIELDAPLDAALDIAASLSPLASRGHTQGC